MAELFPVDTLAESFPVDTLAEPGPVSPDKDLLRMCTLSNVSFFTCLLKQKPYGRRVQKKYRNIQVARLQFYRFLCYNMASDPNLLPLRTPARLPNLPLRLGFVPEPSGRRAFVWQVSLRAAFFKDRYKGCAAF